MDSSKKRVAMSWADISENLSVSEKKPVENKKNAKDNKELAYSKTSQSIVKTTETITINHQEDVKEWKAIDICKSCDKNNGIRCKPCQIQYMTERQSKVEIQSKKLVDFVCDYILQRLNLLLQNPPYNANLTDTYFNFFANEENLFEYVKEKFDDYQWLVKMVGLPDIHQRIYYGVFNWGKTYWASKKMKYHFKIIYDNKCADYKKLFSFTIFLNENNLNNVTD